MYREVKRRLEELENKSEPPKAKRPRIVAIFSLINF
jgi:hypothetical protein